jgi:5-formyltetrahydrofolate cyclo-ligase
MTRAQADEDAMADIDDIKARKSALRASQKVVRKAAAERYGAAAAQALRDHGLAFTGVRSPAAISAFFPIGDELDPMPLLERMMGEGYSVCLPVMEGKGKPLVFRAWKPGDDLATVTWGIREPLASAPVVEPDIVLAALLAFDDRGYRLGYGGGFYDRTLARLRAIKPSAVVVALAFDELHVDAVPHNDYDERVDWVLTPSGPRKCSTG